VEANLACSRAIATVVMRAWRESGSPLGAASTGWRRLLAPGPRAADKPLPHNGVLFLDSLSERSDCFLLGVLLADSIDLPSRPVDDVELVHR